MDAVEISRVHYESWPSMVLGPYKGFIRGQVTEGSGASAAHGVARPPSSNVSPCGRAHGARGR